jgi:hypothetical protein
VDHTSALFRAVARETIRSIGRVTGSLLPAVQSYSDETFRRIFDVGVGVPSRAAFGSKASGASCKLSPDPIAANPARAVEHDYDSFGPNSLRLEVRIGEPGGGAGISNELAGPHYVVLMLIAIGNGIRACTDQADVPTWDALHCCEQPLDASHAEALASFERSRILRDGYGRALHNLVVRHARFAADVRSSELETMAQYEA